VKQTHSMDYRPEIDGLRAVAVLPVILFHAGLKVLGGGYVGVDIFFVISGYLITTILLAELEQGRFSVRRFYERRARRILPALFVVMLVCIPLGWKWMLPGEFRSLAETTIGVALFASNFVFWRDSGYFSPAVEEMPLLHTWSLAVEEQFYIVFPLLLWALWRFGRKKTLLVIIALSGVSLVMAEYASRYHPVANFYLLPTRAWELGTGAVCAFLLHGKAQRENGFLAMLGLMLIGWSIFMFGSSTPFPSFYTLFPVLGTALIILCSGPNTFVGRVLSAGPLVGIGLISYSAYLWHQPLFAFARIRSIYAPAPAVMALMVVLSLVLAYLTWKYVEQPFRGRGRFSVWPRTKIFGASALASVCFIAFSAFVQQNGGLRDRIPPAAVNIAYGAFNEEGRSACGVDYPAAVPRVIRKCALRAGPIDAILFGDSHAGSMAAQLNKQALQLPDGPNIASVSYPGCIPVPGMYRLDKGLDHDCPGFVKEVLSFARQNHVRTLILVARWPLYFEGTMYDNQDGGIEHGTFAPVDTSYVRVHRFPTTFEVERKRRVREKILSSLTSLAAEGFNIVLVHSIPEAGWHVPRVAARTLMFRHSLPDTLSTRHEVYLKRVAAVDKVLSSLSSDRVRHVIPEKYLCDRDVAGRCMNISSGQILYSDDDHLSYLGARPITAEILSAVRESTPPRSTAGNPVSTQ
jgi:peptidoglycan/LPS O-acetylase OafA/YrhL